MAISVGEAAPSFTLLNHAEEPVRLGDFVGKWVVLYFYPKDDTPGCTVEAIDFTAAAPAFEKLGAVIVGVSPDSPTTHCAFRDKHTLGITLLSDPDHTVLAQYDAWRLKKNYGKEYMGVARSTVLIDPTGKIAHYWPNVTADGHAHAVQTKLQALQPK